MTRLLIKDTVNHENESVTIAGWVHVRRDHGKIIFLDMRDVSGLLQVVVLPGAGEFYEKAKDARSEWVLKIIGNIQRRPEGMKNPDITTGDFEMAAQTIEVLSEAKTLPFSVDGDGYDISEELRWKYRYLDMRRTRVKEILQARHKVKQALRAMLTEKGFIEIDTPILTKSTPEGARDFLVPSRHYPGKFYALPQSPQQYKQLLMVGGIDKYFQFARCFRDEDLRNDRLFEFDQMDIEMSFIEQEDIISLLEELAIYATETVLGKTIQEKPFPRMTYADAMKNYGRDNPDLRKSAEEGQSLLGGTVPPAASSHEDKNLMAYTWITDFPMFEKKEDGSWGAAHHPFTAIVDDDIVKLDDASAIGQIRAKQYDLVLNGAEVFGGSIRTTDPAILTKVFQVLGHSEEEIKDRFGHLLEAFSYGVPPHGGIAGFDRWLLVLLGEQSIREVIPFPTTGNGRTSVMDAPSTVEEAQTKELHLKIILEKEKK